MSSLKSKTFKLIYALVTAFVITEAILQVSVRYDIGIRLNPIFLYNPYCDQEYWEINSARSNFDDTGLEYHPLLSYKAAGEQESPVTNKSQNSVLIFGSSFTGHKTFQNIIPSNKNWKNFSVPSYGLDQIYTSYEISKTQFPNSTIVIGFLLEDLDRSIFSFREYQKIQYNRKNNLEFSPQNVPVKNKKPNISFDIYLIQLIKNLHSLYSLKFKTKSSTCHIKQKKILFEYFFNSILKSSQALNQSLIIITFNFEEDFYQANDNWRKSFIQNYFSKKTETNVDQKLYYVDTQMLIKEHMKNGNTTLSSYFNPVDRHYSEKAFKLVVDKIIALTQYQ